MAAPDRALVPPGGHLAVRRSGSNWTFYIDGVAVAWFTDTTNMPNIDGPPLWLGSGAESPLDEIEIFSRALSASEIQAIYNAGTGGKCKTCTASGVPNGALCDDGLFCTVTDTCSGGTCIGAGDPCTGGAECNTTCNEATDDCFDSTTASCTTDGNVCTNDVCDGTGGCVHLAGNAGTICRSSAGACDSAETCDGVSTICPADGFQPDTVECRATAGVCDVAENCTGSSAACPSDAKSSATCRAAAGPCDIAETCNGSSATCPANSFAAQGSQPAGCDGTMACNVAGTCLLADSQACSSGPQCASGSCVGGTCGGVGVPTLSEWGIIVFSALAFVFVLWHARGRRRRLGS